MKELYFHFLTKYPPVEEQDMGLWGEMLERFEKDDKMYILVEEDDRVVSTVQMEVTNANGGDKRMIWVVE